MAGSYLNHDLSINDVRWAIGRETSKYDAWRTFARHPHKSKLPAGTHLFRLVPMAVGRWFDGHWWMPEQVFHELLADAEHSKHGGGRLFRNYVAQYMALPKGDFQLSVIEIELTRPVYAWAEDTAPLFHRPGGVPQIFLPNLADRGHPQTSENARLVRTYWLRF